MINLWVRFVNAEITLPRWMPQWLAIGLCVCIGVGLGELIKVLWLQ